MRCPIVFLLLIPLGGIAQPDFFEDLKPTTAQRMRGLIYDARDYDVSFYDLSVDFNLDARSIKGKVQMHFTVPEKRRRLQIDLAKQFKIKSVKLFGEKKLRKHRAGDAFIVKSRSFKPGISYWIEIEYEGIPQVAENAPWDGGFVWSKDSITGKPWVGVACEGLGASSWWPCKDHLSDEPDSMKMHFTVPSGLKAISNGKFVKQETQGQRSTYHWKVHYPINSYNVTFYIGDYVNAEAWIRKTDETAFWDAVKADEEYAIDFWVLNNPVSIGGVEELHFQQTYKMLEFFHKFVGPYPFPKDGYKLVEAPYWGMEHQSAIAYGNAYNNNEFGFDFIIQHESGHEWFGNLVSVADHADMWIHEAFTTYLEALYVEWLNPGQEIPYLWTQRRKIKNEMPVQGPRNINFGDWPAADMYYKGTWMLHTLRTLVNNDPLWFSTLKSIPKEFAHKPVYTEDITSYMSKKLSLDLSGFFDQYLNYAALPKLEYKIVEGENGNATIEYRYVGGSPNFNYPVKYSPDGYRWITLTPNRTAQTTHLYDYNSGKGAGFDEDHYLIDFVEVSP